MKHERSNHWFLRETQVVASWVREASVFFKGVARGMWLILRCLSPHVQGYMSRTNRLSGLQTKQTRPWEGLVMSVNQGGLKGRSEGRV